jgi:hypothetical protein
MTISRRAAADLAAAAALLAATFLLYHRILGLFWIYDTPFHLRLLSAHGPLEFLFSPAPWSQEKNVFTPLFFLSLAFDRALGGPSPAVYYLHQLAAIAGCSLALYAALRLWLAPSLAAAGALLFLVGSSVAASAPVLGVRHYFEALTLACLAFALYVIALRRRRPAWTLASAALFLAALLAKEIAAPLLVLAALAPEADWRRRLRYLVPHGAALAIYGVWRIVLLEQPLAGHGWIDRRSVGEALSAWPGDLLAALCGRPFGLALALAIALAAALAPARRCTGAILATAAASLAMVVPFAFEIQPRFALTTWLLLAAGMACGAARLAGRPGGARAAAGLAAATIALAALAGRDAWVAEYARSSRMSVENRAFVALPADAALRHPASSTSTLLELRPLATTPATWYQDDLYLCAARTGLRTIVGYDEATATVREVTRAALAEGARYCAAIAEATPLAARFEWLPQGLLWELGPAADSAYSFVIDDGMTRLAVPRRGGYRWQGDRLRLRVRHETAAGAVTYSPPLELDRRRPELRWQR